MMLSMSIRHFMFFMMITYRITGLVSFKAGKFFQKTEVSASPFPNFEFLLIRHLRSGQRKVGGCS